MEPSSNFAYHVLNTLQQKKEMSLLVVNGECITGGKFHERVTTIINLLKWKGILPNSRVLMTIQPSIDFYAVAIAVLAVGGSIIIIDTSMGIERCDHCIASAKPSVWVWKKGSKERFLKYVLPSVRSTPLHLELGHLDLPSVSQELFNPMEVEPVEHALVTFTTGSLGMPKLLLRKHSFLLNQSQSLSASYELIMRKELDMEEVDVVYCTNLPVFPLHYLNVGSLCILYPNIKKANPSEMIKTFKKYDCTALIGSPAFLEKVSTYALKNNIMLPLKCTGAGGAPVFRGTLRTISSATPGGKTFVLYGSTEAEPISVIISKEKMELESTKPDGLCVGQPIFKGTVKIIQILENTILDPIDISKELEVPLGTVGEVIVSGWHVNTYQVDTKRLITDLDGVVWLKIEDAGYMDEESRIWLVGRVKWRVEKGGRTFWSTVVEQKVLDRCSLITFAAYLPHKEESWLFLEAPKGLPDKEKAGLKSFLDREGIPTDHLEICKHIPRDRRHNSKPDTSVLFQHGSPNSPFKIILFLLKANPLFAIFIVFIQIFLIFCVLLFIISH